MNFTNVLVDVYRMSGSNPADKTRSLYAEGVSLLMVPASTETQAFYADVPVGQLQSFLITDQVDDIKQDDILKVVDPMDSVYAVDDEFIVNGRSKRTMLLGNRLIEGVCISK